VRFQWLLKIPLWVQIVALFVNALGWSLHIWAMVANRFHAKVVRIQSDRGQTVVTDGPYRYVRHPGYVGGIMLNFASPIMLGSLWALIPGVLGVLLLAIRTVLEDRMLLEELEGYKEYAQRVYYRLLPGIW
jgi:protein-S-isoprenylcysteine O-methyltransferase Ste14